MSDVPVPFTLLIQLLLVAVAQACLVASVIQLDYTREPSISNAFSAAALFVPPLVYFVAIYRAPVMLGIHRLVRIGVIAVLSIALSVVGVLEWHTQLTPSEVALEKNGHVPQFEHVPSPTLPTGPIVLHAIHANNPRFPRLSDEQLLRVLGIKD
jgi:hypothetical protein